MKILLIVLFVAPAWCFPQDQGSPWNIFNIAGAIENVTNNICYCRCGQSIRDTRSVDSKSLGGDTIVTHEQPWQVLVIVKSKIAAGGTIITDKHVLTAASPVVKEVAYDVKVTAAVHDRCVGDVTSANISAQAIVVHPAYSPATREHDLAIIRLGGGFKSFGRYAPICFPSKNSYEGDLAIVVSWLAPDPAPGAAEPRCGPRRIRQPILTTDECTRTVTTQSFITPDHGCMGVIGAKSVICAGDVGTGVIFKGNNGNHELLGVLTDKNTCDQTNSTIFTKVKYHMDWVITVLNGECICRN